jgi:hypothetical protein
VCPTSAIMTKTKWLRDLLAWGLVRVVPNAMIVNMRIVRLVLVTGDRHWTCPDLAERIVSRLIARCGYDLVIIHGGACGFDQSFAVACRNLGIGAEPHLPDWWGLGNIAGPARNRRMVEEGADLCIALHRTIESSKGTKDCVRQAIAAWDGNRDAISIDGRLAFC